MSEYILLTFSRGEFCKESFKKVSPKENSPSSSIEFGKDQSPTPPSPALPPPPPIPPPPRLPPNGKPSPPLLTSPPPYNSQSLPAKEPIEPSRVDDSKSTGPGAEDASQMAEPERLGWLV